MCSTLTFGRLRPQDRLRQREGNTVCTALTRSTSAEPRTSARPGSARIGRNGSLGGGNSGRCETRVDDAHGEEETEDIGLHHEMAAIDQYSDEIG
jgi:hypothetical protein